MSMCVFYVVCVCLRQPTYRPRLDGIKDNRVSRQQVEILVEEDAAYVVRVRAC